MADEFIELTRKLEHAHYWYGTRLDTLEKWARANLNDEQKNQFFQIVANGNTHDPYDPPTFAQQYNSMKHRAERAEAELDKLRNAGVTACAQPQQENKHG